MLKHNKDVLKLQNTIRTKKNEFWRFLNIPLSITTHTLLLTQLAELQYISFTSDPIFSLMRLTNKTYNDFNFKYEIITIKK